MLRRFLLAWGKAWIMLLIAGAFFSLIAFFMDGVSPFAGVRIVLETPAFQIMLVVVSLLMAILNLFGSTKGDGDTMGGPGDGGIGFD